MRTYITVAGDKWDAIAYRELGSSLHTDKLMRANSAYIDYYTFPAGITLTLPDVDKNERRPDNTPPWKRVEG